MTYLKNKEWDLVLSPQKSLFDVGIKQLLRYKDLIYLFVYRDFVSQFKQTVLGPLWFFIQPILTTITFTRWHAADIVLFIWNSSMELFFRMRYENIRYIHR